MIVNKDFVLIQENPEKCKLQSGKRKNPSFSNFFLKQRRRLLHQQLAYVRMLFTKKSKYVHGMTQDRARTPLYISKKIKDHIVLQGRDNWYYT
jgi:hypothetical protein